MKTRVWAGILAAGLLLAGVSAEAVTARIVSVSLSSRILLDFYTAYQNRQVTLPVAARQLFQMVVATDAAIPTLRFRVEIRDGNTWVARVNTFGTRALRQGQNRVSAGEIRVENLTLEYNTAYAPATGDWQGQVLPMGNYRVFFIPVEPAGPDYVTNLALFTPQAALNMPPVAIYPKNIEVNTVLPTFSWTPVAKAAYYRVWVGPDVDPGVNTYWQSDKIQATQTLYLPAARQLENGQTYYWQVVAFDTFGQRVGGADGRSQPAWFRINSAALASSVVSPTEADAVLRQVIQDPTVFRALENYRPAAVESTSQDPADLLIQLRTGSATIQSFHIE